MLENYYEEIGRKRRERWVFWIIVWMLSTFLYLFFQGYYPYVRLDMGKFFEEDRPVAKPQVVRAFGIINVMAIPIPDAITVSSSTFGTKIIPNDDKGFFDFGTYSIRVEKDGYLPISLRATLSKEDSFSISVLELFKRPLYAPFPIPADFAEDLGGGRILVRERAMT